MKNILLALAFFISLLITFDLFLKEPPVWPDEANYAYIVSISKGLLDNLVHYPSIYSSVLAIWFQITGVSIEAQRAFSLIAGLGCLIMFGLIVRNISKALTISVVLLVSDFTFLQATRVGRPEIFSLFFGLVSVYLFLKFILGDYKNIYYLVFSFLFSLLSCFFHANGVIYLLTFLLTIFFIFKNLSKRFKQIIFLSGTIFALLSVTLTLKLINFLKVYLTRINVSNAQDSWIFTVLTTKPFELKIIYIFFIICSILFFIFVIKRRSISLILLSLPLLFSWAVLIFNKDFWYAVYIVPFVYLSLYILLENHFQKFLKNKTPENKIKFITLVSICLFLFFANLKTHLNILAVEGGDKYSYHNYIQNIRQIVPDGATVFSSAIPDPYYAFIDRKNNPITRFPQSFVEDRSGYLKLLGETDFIIYNGPYGSNYYGNTVSDYMKLNTQKITEIGGPDQYSALVVELKPRDKRINP